LTYRIKFPVINLLYPEGVSQKNRKDHNYVNVVGLMYRTIKMLSNLSLNGFQKDAFLAVLLRAADNRNHFTDKDLEGLTFKPQLEEWQRLGLIEVLDDNGQPMTVEDFAARRKIQVKAPNKPRVVKAKSPIDPPYTEEDANDVLEAYVRAGDVALRPKQVRARKMTPRKLACINKAFQTHDKDMTMEAAAFGWAKDWNIRTGNIDLTWFLRIDDKHDNVEKFASLAPQG
jgi:hypothetical protein